MPQLFGQRLIEVRRVEQRYSSKAEDSFVGQRAILGNDVEFGPAQGPPWPRDPAIRNHAVIKDILFTEPFSPLAFKMEWAAGAQHSDARHYAGNRRADRVVELTLFFVQIIFHLTGKNLFMAKEIFVMHTTASLGIAGLGVEVDFVRIEHHVGCL